MRNAGRVLGALLCTAALAGSALALRVVPGGRVLALLFCSPGAAFTLWQQAGVEPPQAQPAAALAESSESPPQPTPEPSVQPTPSPTPQPTAEREATPAPTITIPPGVQTTAPILDRTFGQGSGQGYIALAAGSIKNATDEPDSTIASAAQGALSFTVTPGSPDPQVLILHTHGSEAYTMPPGEEYEDTGSFRTADARVSVIRVGDELARVLSGYGISVLHDRALYDDPEYNGAYYRAEDAIEAYMEKYPSIGFILDVHRDALEDKAGHQYKVVTREDPDCAQVSLVMGSSWEGWQENLKFAVAVQQHLTERHPTLMRPLTLRNSDYNEYFTPGSLLVEVGAAGNSLDEALSAARLFAQGFAEVVTGKK